MTIEDLAPQVWIEALEPLAVKSDLTPGLLLVNRSGVVDRSVLVRLNVAGTASRSDYDGAPTFANFLPGQTTALLPVTPKPAAVLSNGVEFVQVSIRPDPAYRIVGPASARIILIEELLTFSLWHDRFFAGAGGDLSAFANEDVGQTGIGHLARYAFGLDAVTPQQSPGRPRHQIRDDHLTVTYRRPLAVTDVQYVVEVSENLVSWHSGAAFVEPLTAPEATNAVETVGYRIKETVSDTGHRFMRVRVLYTP